MAYSTYVISSVSEVPGAVQNFAASLGFITGGEDPVTVRHPSYSQARTFAVSHSIISEGTTGHREYVSVGVQGVSGAADARAESPKFNTDGGANLGSLVVQQPTLLRLFGNLETAGGQPGSSWIAGVIEYGFNLYRHFYLGYVQKATNFTGGEVVTGSAQWVSVPGQSTSYRGDLSALSLFPFSMRNNYANGPGGGVRVEHSENGTTWRSFYASSSSSSDFDAAFSSSGDSCVLGGFLDSINSGYLSAGKSPFSGTQILVPINLYIGYRLEPNQYFRAIGAPAGVRMVHMEDLEPGATVQIGTQEWMVFPVFSKKAVMAVNRHGSSATPSAYRYPYENSSQYVGMAYLMNE